MTLYKCRECEEIFNKPEERSYRERVEYWGCVTMEEFTYDVCPNCHSEEIYECEDEEEIDES